MQTQWNKEQRHCLNLMGFDWSYLGLDDVAVEAADKITEPASQKAKKITQTTQHKTTPRTNPFASQETDVQPSMHKRDNPDSTAPPPSQPIQAEADKKQQISVTSDHAPPLLTHRYLYVLGHQEKFDDLLFGKQLVADLCLYLNHQSDDFNYVSLVKDDYVTQLNELFSQFVDDSSQANNISIHFILPQGEEQANQVSAVMSNESSLQSTKDSRMVLLPSLTNLLSKPDAKFQALQQVI